METSLKVITLKEFAIERQFVSIAPSVRENMNGYPYITFIDKANKAENVYFSKRAAENVAAGTEITPALLAKHQVGFTTNSEGETRIKLISNSERVDLLSML